mmetsp:Transcript_36998/g.86138  ORF Transcript_36998/g.86138 Transcript_36998/m.86138 type:complete len:276 (-) Transcript_36998:166-993(-)
MSATGSPWDTVSPTFTTHSWKTHCPGGPTIMASLGATSRRGSLPTAAMLPSEISSSFEPFRRSSCSFTMTPGRLAGNVTWEPLTLVLTSQIGSPVSTMSPISLCHLTKIMPGGALTRVSSAVTFSGLSLPSIMMLQSTVTPSMMVPRFSSSWRLRTTPFAVVNTSNILPNSFCTSATGVVVSTDRPVLVRYLTKVLPIGTYVGDSSGPIVSGSNLNLDMLGALVVVTGGESGFSSSSCSCLVITTMAWLSMTKSRSSYASASVWMDLTVPGQGAR